MQNNLLRSIFKKQLITITFLKNSLFKTVYLMKNDLLRSIFKKITYSKQHNLCKIVYYNLFLKNSLFKSAYLMQNSLLQYLFKKNSLFKTVYLMKNDLLRSLFKKQLIQNSLSYANQLIMITF